MFKKLKYFILHSEIACDKDNNVLYVSYIFNSYKKIKSLKFKRKFTLLSVFSFYTDQQIYICNETGAFSDSNFPSFFQPLLFDNRYEFDNWVLEHKKVEDLKNYFKENNKQYSIYFRKAQEKTNEKCW
jgi:hypothetical protein